MSKRRTVERFLCVDGMNKQLLSFLAIALTLLAFFPYVRAIWKGESRPHLFSWIIWGLTTFIVFLAQLAEGGGAGAWPIGVSAIISIYVAALAWKMKADTDIAPVDWVFLFSALGSLLLWLFTADPTGSVIILTIVDLAGFGPTFRKAYSKPREENMVFFALFAVRNVLVLFALENYNLATVLFPTAVFVACVALIALIVVRRGQGN
ncbi:MAG: hypothetical protein ACO1QB_01135 [Verrucomicrobiales bacterium]